jgi:hypothetical protein
MLGALEIATRVDGWNNEVYCAIKSVQPKTHTIVVAGDSNFGWDSKWSEILKLGFTCSRSYPNLYTFVLEEKK